MPIEESRGARAEVSVIGHERKRGEEEGQEVEDGCISAGYLSDSTRMQRSAAAQKQAPAQSTGRFASCARTHRSSSRSTSTYR
jgi:hypothetical protein